MCPLWGLPGLLRRLFTPRSVAHIRASDNIYDFSIGAVNEKWTTGIDPNLSILMKVSSSKFYVKQICVS